MPVWTRRTRSAVGLPSSQPGVSITAFRTSIDLKLARLVRDPSHLDSIIDVAGYAACLREVTRG
jgi:Domain of unknown function (DUF6378)